MAKQVKAQSAEEYKQERFGSGQIARTTDYLKKDPASYYHEMLKNSRYYRDNMWSEAAIRGELPNLIQYITDSEKNGNPNFDRYLQYESMSDYETYMSNLATASADNTTKKTRKDEETGYVYGDYTDKEWLEKVLESTYQKYEFELEKQRKENATFWEHVGAFFVAVGTGIEKSAFESAKGILDIVSGLKESAFYLGGKIFGSETKWESLGQAFTAGLTEQEGTGDLVTDALRFLVNEPIKTLDYVSSQYQKDYMWTTYYDQDGNLQYTEWGQILNSSIDFVGMLLPSIGAGKLAKWGTKGLAPKVSSSVQRAARQSAFYLPIFSRYANQSVNQIMTDTGCTFKDINSGEVITNAALKTVAEWGIERLMARFLRTTTLDKMVGVDSIKAVGKVKDTVVKSLENTGASRARAFGATVGRLAADAGKEGLEEVLQDFSTGLIDIAFGGSYANQGFENLTFKNLMLSFTIGALVSTVVGSVNDLRYAPMSQRIKEGVAVGVGEDEKPYKLSYFQALTFKDAMDKINNWNYIINDESAKLSDRIDANLKMAITMDAIASVAKLSSTEDFLEAAKLLDAKYKKDKDKVLTSRQITMRTNKVKKAASKAEQMLNDFYAKQAENAAKYIDEKQKEAAAKALEKNKDKLEEKGVSEVTNIITNKVDPNDKNLNIPKERLEVLKSALDKIGVSMVISVDGAVTIKSEDVLIAPDELVKTANIGEILKGIAYDQVVTTVSNSLTKQQKLLLSRFYEQITGSWGSDSDIVTALLFDKKFYTKALLLCGEDINNFKNETERKNLLKILATVDQIVNRKYLSKELKNGRLSQQAFDTLMNKVRETLNTGLIVYCTQYVNIDFGIISKDVLPLDLSKRLDEIVKNNKNVIFTNRLNEIKKNIKNFKEDKEVEQFISMLDRYKGTNVPNELLNRAELMIHSNNVEDRSEAVAFLELIARNEHYINNEKVVYLPYSIAEGTNAQYREDMDVTAKFFGDFSFDEIVNTGMDPNKLTQEAINFISENGYNLSDKTDRMKCIDEILNRVSNNKLTIGADGTILRVLDKHEFLKDEYLGENGNNKLLKDLSNEKVKTVGDITRISNLSNKLKDVKITKINAGQSSAESGLYSERENTIYVFRDSVSEIIMHELTHATQHLTKVNVGIDYTGSNLNIFKGLDKKTLNDIDNYMQNEMSLVYDYLKYLDPNMKTPMLIYFNTRGEVEARAMATVPISEFGFTWKTENDKRYLVSPDGKKSWEMKANIVNASSETNVIRQMFKDTITREELARQEMQNILEQRRKSSQISTKTTEKEKTSQTQQKTVKNRSKISVGQISMFDNLDLELPDIRQNEKQSRFVSSKYANTKPGLKGYVRKGQKILMHPDLFRFLYNLTEEDLAKLDKRLQDLILEGKLTYEGNNSINDFVATAKKMGDFTFKKIARDVYQNEELAKLSFEQYEKIRKNIVELSAMEIMLNPLSTTEKRPEAIEALIEKDVINKKMSYNNLMKLMEKFNDLSNKNKEVENWYARADEWAQLTISGVRKSGKNIRQKIEPKDIIANANIPMFLHYDGTLRSINHARGSSAQSVFISNKYIEDSEALEQIGITEEGDFKIRSKTYSPNTRLNREYKKATENYVDPILSDATELTEFVTKYFVERTIVQNSKKLGRELTRSEQLKIARYNQEKFSKMPVDELSDYYYKILLTKMNKKNLIKDVDIEITPEGEKKIAQDNLYNNLLKLLREIGEDSTYYDKLPEEIKQYIVLNTKRTSSEYKYKLNTYTKTYKNKKTGEEKKKSVQSFRNLSTDEVLRLLEITRQEFKKIQKIKSQPKKQLEQLKKRAKKLEEQKKIEEEKRLNAEKLLFEEKKTKSMKDKLSEAIEHRTKVVNHTFEIASPIEPNDTVKSLLNTQWTKMKMSEVQGLSVNQDQNVTNAKEFFMQNREVLTQFKTNEDILDAIDYFLRAKMLYDPKASNEENNNNMRNFEAIKTYFFGFILDELKKENNIYSFIDDSTKNKIEQALRLKTSIGMTTGAIWKRVREIFNPWDYWRNADIEIEGVPLTDGEKKRLFDAAEKGQIDEMDKVMKEITARVIKEPSTKKSFARRLIAFRQIAMLSSPITMLRNLISNMVLKRLNRLADKIGGGFFKGHTEEGQVKLNGKVYTYKNGRIQLKGDITKPVQEFINKNFIDNKFFDKIVGNISRYNLNDLGPSAKDFKGDFKKDAIFAQMMLKAMYGQFYNDGLFKSKFMNDVHKLVMKGMSDTPWVREATMRYFAKILVEKGYRIDEKTQLTDEIMNDFGCAVGLGLADYMHQDNIFTKIETYLSENSEAGLFLWKGIMPFAGAGFQWYKAFLRFSPLGLINALWKFTGKGLKKQIAKAESAWGDPEKAGSQSIAPKFTEFIIRRQIGQGIIGTILMFAGALLAGLGWIRLEDDDYGTPKLHVGNLKVDVSSIFGSNSLLAGASLVTAFQESGTTLEKLRESFNRYAASTLDGFPLMSLIELDAYNADETGMLFKYGENLALSFIPNFLSWIAGATYVGDFKKSNILEKAFAKLPAGVYLSEAIFGTRRKVDIYTGEKYQWQKLLGRFLPYISWELASETEVKTRNLGLNKQELKGKYTILDETFELSPKETEQLNTYYGTWNAKDLEEFYTNTKKVRVKVGNKYVYLTHDQMDDTQRKTAVQNIMTSNAELCKIYAWISKGNKYYASDEIYSKLMQKGIRTNVYKGTQGFVKK